ncbi:MAG: septal ring lytic transglycosylase RlpA family lipoprotein [Betaproteobacteria bacterium HGW-Betaproteobacteria-8]|nr:MAG: septal ring lytic transglycosylase RlpA family lipoprotein [Betaproteobacteria bacterium HGW-Betaproteobacteria-8]
MKIINILAIGFLTLLITACGSSTVKPDSPKVDRSGTNQSTPSGKSAKGGGYYLDDGPGEISLAELERIPDATPRAEPAKASNSRPYKALGQQYVPMKEFRPYNQRGVASWYGKRYHGNQTASGEPYDMYAMTAAHTILPIPSYVRVTNPENGRSVVVRVNDRGPFLHDRLIDLSYVAAYKLGIVQKGSGMVDIEWIDTSSPEAIARSAPQPASSPTNGNAGVYVQVGAFKSQENADRLRENLQNQNLAVAEDGRNVPIQSWYNENTYRVRLGPYMSRSEADQAASRINQSIGTNAIVVFQN